MDGINDKNKQNNSYDEIVGQQQTYQESVAASQNPNGVTETNPNTGVEETREATAADAKLNTGSGVEAAVGTDYSWNKQGQDKAKISYNADILNKKQEMLNNRQTLETNAVNYQNQADMMKYQNNQNAEKVGWTGGYVLDQNRQMEYLKSSIQAQMYGAMELQKYGYDSALAAARLAYDMNQQEYAHQYYQEAVTAALSEAQLTGTYFSAEVKDMMSQRAVAQQKLDADPNDEQAQKVVKQINDWFKANGVSEAGVKTLEAWQQEQANELQWSNELWTRYQAALSTARTDIAENSSLFIKLDENGKEIWDGNNVTTGNWDAYSNQDVFDYLFSGRDGTINTSAVQQYYSHLDSTVVGETEAGFNKWCTAKGLISTDENGKAVIKAGDFTSLFIQYMKESGIVNKMKERFGSDLKESKPGQLQELYDIFKEWDFRFQMPDGSYRDLSYDDLLNIESSSIAQSKEAGSTITKEVTDSNGNKTEEVVYDLVGNELKNYTFTTPVKSQYGDYKSTLSQGSQVCLTTAYWDGKNGSNAGGLKDADISVVFGDVTNSEVPLLSEAAGGYNVEIDSDQPRLGNLSNEINSMIYKATGSAPKFGQIITTGETAYVYWISTSDQNKLNNNGVALTDWTMSGTQPASWNVGNNSTTGWYPIKGQCGGSQKSNDLITALKDAGMLV